MYGKRIKEKRELFGISRKELAIRIVSTPQVIKLWEEEKVEPSIADLIILSAEFNTTIDWLVGAVENNYENDEFIECALTPHMNDYIFVHKDDDPAYIHIQLTVDGEADDCIMYSGRSSAILSSINVLLGSIAEESNINYYDLVAMLASAHAGLELGDLHNDE